MNKFVLLISKNNKSWCICNAEMVSVTDADGVQGWALDEKIYNWQTMRSYYSVPTQLLHDRIVESKYVFDSRAAATGAVDSIIRDRILEVIKDKERQIEILQEDIEKVKTIQSKGRFRNFLNPKLFKP